jgi:hypothetical protein
MYTSYIGKKFLRIYNRKNEKKLTAKKFFDDEFFKIFFDNEQHLMHVSNSPFFQKPSAKAMEGGLTKSEAQLKKLHQDIALETPNMAIFVGYAAKDIFGTTSGQMSSMNYTIDAEEMYASWIGEALGVGISGGFVILIDKEEVLWSLFEGWVVYRRFLSQTLNLKDKQIETWNGRWLTHRLSSKYNAEEPTDGFSFEPENVLGKLAITTQKWSEVLFALALKYPSQELVAYAYNLSQTNTTLGFVKLFLHEVHKPFEWRDKLFINEEKTILNDEQIMSLETYYNFKGACKFGTIGLKALEPDKLREFMPVPFGRGKEYKFSDEASHTQFQIFKIWIMAMLNKKELLQLAGRVAKALVDYEATHKLTGRGTTKVSEETKQILEAKTQKGFFDSLTDLLAKAPENNTAFREVVTEVLTMPIDSFPLFITLIRFEHTSQKINNPLNN